MSSNIVNQVPFLRNQRQFPKEIEQMSVEVDKSYIDISNAVNNRTISTFPTDRPAVDGEAWFLNGQKWMGLRQVYPITGEGTYPHNVDDYAFVNFTRIYGTFTDESTAPGGPFWYPLPWVDVVSATNNIELFLDDTNINVTGGGGGAQPVVVSGFVVLEWIVPVNKLNLVV